MSRGLREGARRVLSVMNAAPIPQLPQAGDELVEGGVQGRCLVDGGGLGTNGRATGSQRHLHPRRTVMLARVLLVGDLHLHPMNLIALVVLVDAQQLLDDKFSESNRDISVPALDDDFHVASRGREQRRTSLFGALRPTVIPDEVAHQSFTYW